MKLYEYTKYQKFFKKVYWGNFDSSDLDMTIIYNRNNFIEDNNIIKVITYTKTKKLQYYLHVLDTYKIPSSFKDHSELYETPDNYIYILSPYTSNYILENEYILLNLGFKRTYDLYSKNATTYILKINKEIVKNTKILSEHDEFEKYVMDIHYK